MKIEIELDINKIDYDAINKQIVGKVAAMNVEEFVDAKTVITNKLTDIVHKMVNDSYSDYIETYDYGTYTTSKGKQLIDEIVRDSITNVTHNFLKDIMEQHPIEKEMFDVFMKYYPVFFVSAMQEIVRNELSYLTCSSMEMARSEAIGVVESRLNHIRYNL